MNNSLNTKNTIVGCVTAVALAITIAVGANTGNDKSNQRRNECAEIVLQNAPAAYSPSDIQSVHNQLC